MFRFLCVASLLALVGCATMEGNRAHLRERYVGKPLATAVTGLGLPASKLEMGDTLVYAWVDTDSWGNECEIRMGVQKDIVISESIKARIPEACERLIR